MNKFVYALSAMIVASLLLVSCKGGDDDDPVAAPKPNVTLQVGPAYTSTTVSQLEGTSFLIGVRVSHSVNLKSAKVTRNFNNTGEVMVWDSTISGNTKLLNRDLNLTLPTGNTGPMVYTISATDKDNQVGEFKLTINITGPLLDRGEDSLFSIFSTTHFSAYDLILGENITAASSAGNQALRDIVDNSTSSPALGKSWKSQNQSRYKKYTGSKQYLQFNTNEEVLAAWNSSSSTGPEVAQIDGIQENDMYIVKCVRSGSTQYMLLAISVINDEAGVEDDYIIFQYKQ